MTTEKDIRNWFGDRGYPIEDNSKLKFKVLNVNFQNKFWNENRFYKILLILFYKLNYEF